MKWKGRQQSSNIEDRRSGGGGGGGKTIGGGIGILVMMAIVWMLGGNPLELLGLLGGGGGGGQTSANYQPSAQENELAQFVSVVLKDTEDVWGQIFANGGQAYREPNLVLYNGSVQSACGYSSAATGPFYCPGDQKVYIDLSFCEELQTKFKAPGDFAMAYVVAHEVGHHIQTLLGTSQKVNQMRGRVPQEEFNQYLVKLELQADFYAGVWAHHAQKMKNVLEEGDVEEALNAAAAVGDDRIQKQAQGYVVPESFTHGTSEQRQRWFYRGFQTGDINQGNTFSADRL
ncbi:MAG: neutral zinc metallopeptidase [Calditrichaeota bacterium]|nr:neutral zinc metallopeptidase [Calditrichota bacterium]HQU72163.1 neutral zinc metallopeptidase [Calditrichia bacterium]